jgi:integrase
MASLIEEKGEIQGEVRLAELQQQQQQHDYDDLQLESSAYSLFVLAIRSPRTKEKYLQRFGYFLDFCQVASGDSIEERCNSLAILAKNDKYWLIKCISRYLQLLKTRVESKEIKASTLRNNVKPIKLFCEQIDVDVPWKKLMRGMPKERKYANDRAPRLEEIIRISEYPDRRIKAIIYTMVSSGMRIGSWDYLRWKDITPIIRDGKVIAAKIKIYSEEEDEYFSFITPEAFYSLDNWMKFRKECGENINENSWVMRNLWDVTTPMGKGVITIPKKLKSTGVKRLIENALWAQNVRVKLESGKKRHEFQADHGFRKWFKTRCEIAGMKSINIETLMAHSIGISDSYYRPTEDELLTDYLKAIPSLTISDERRLQDQVNELSENTRDNDYIVKAKLQEKDAQIESLTKKQEQFERLLQSLIDSGQIKPSNA